MLVRDSTSFMGVEDQNIALARPHVSLMEEKKDEAYDELSNAVYQYSDMEHVKVSFEDLEVAGANEARVRYSTVLFL